MCRSKTPSRKAGDVRREGDSYKPLAPPSRGQLRAADPGGDAVWGHPRWAPGRRLGEQPPLLSAPFPLLLEEVSVRSQRCPRDANECFSSAPSSRRRQLGPRAGPRAKDTAGGQWPRPRGEGPLRRASRFPAAAGTRGSRSAARLSWGPCAGCLCATAWPWTPWGGEGAAANCEQRPLGRGRKRHDSYFLSTKAKQWVNKHNLSCMHLQVSWSDFPLKIHSPLPPSLGKASATDFFKISEWKMANISL